MSRLSDRRDSAPDQETVGQYLARVGLDGKAADKTVTRALAHYTAELAALARKERAS